MAMVVAVSAKLSSAGSAMTTRIARIHKIQVRKSNVATESWINPTKKSAMTATKYQETDAPAIAGSKMDGSAKCTTNLKAEVTVPKRTMLHIAEMAFWRAKKFVMTDSL